MPVQVSLTIEISASASLAEMEQQIQEAGQQALREALKQAIRHWEDQKPACPHCGEKQRRLEGTVRRSIATTFGRVQVPRRRFRCQGCWQRWCPANHLFAQLKGGTESQPLQEAALLAGCSWPYRVASTQLKRLSGAQISAEEIRLLTNRQGKQRAAHQQEEAERACSSPASEAPSAEKAEQPMLVGLDGGWVCSREQRGGMEGKVAVVGSQMEDLPMPTPSTTFSWSERGPRRPPRQRHRLARRRYVATFSPSQQLGQQAQAAARAKPLSQRERDYQLYLHRSWLWQGGVDQALQGVRDLGTGLPAEPLETIQKTITYLEHQRPWIGSYEHWRKLGYPVGSGMIERAVALVINRRMKKRGMRWCRPNATAVVALRTDLLNDDWMTPQRLRAFP
jgi:hypothetical protein